MEAFWYILGLVSPTGCLMFKEKSEGIKTFRAFTSYGGGYRNVVLRTFYVRMV